METTGVWGLAPSVLCCVCVCAKNNGTSAKIGPPLNTSIHMGEKKGNHVSSAWRKAHVLIDQCVRLSICLSVFL